MALGGGWIVSSVIRLSHTNFTSGMAAVARSTTLANEQMLRQQGIITRNEALMRRYQRSLDEARASQTRLGTTVAGVGFAIGVAGLVAATAEAAKFEKAMTGVQIATGATQAQFKMLSDMAYNVSGVTAQSAATIANELYEAARVAQHRPEDLAKIFPQMAKYADVRYIAHGEDPTKTIELMSQFSHYFQAYGPGAMSRMLDNAAKLQMTTNAELPQLVYQGKYFIPSSKNAGVSEDTIFKYLAIMAQGGFLTGRGGTSMENVVQRLSLMTQYGHMSKNAAKAVDDLGLVDRHRNLKSTFLDDKGTLQIIPFVDYLMKKREEFNQKNARLGNGRFSGDLKEAFGLQAKQLLDFLTSKTTQEQMQRNADATRKVPGVEGQWQKYNKDLFYEWRAFVTDIDNIGLALALPSLPDIERGFHAMNIQLQNIGNWLKKNPDAAKKIFETGAAITAIFGVRFIAGIANAGFAMLGFRKSVDALTAALVKDSLIIDGATVGASAGGAMGLLGRLKGFSVGVLSFIDDLLLAGAGKGALKIGGKAFAWATNLTGSIFEALGSALRAGGTLWKKTIGKELAWIFKDVDMVKPIRDGLGNVLKSINKAIPVDLFKHIGVDGLERLFLRLGPWLLKLPKWMTGVVVAVEKFAPKFAGFADVFGAALGRILGFLARFLAAIPGIDIAALVLNPTAAGSDEQAWLNAHPNNGRRPGASNYHISVGDIHVHAGDPKDAGRKTFEFLTGLGGSHPVTLRGRAGNNWTNPRIGNGSTVLAR